MPMIVEAEPSAEEVTAAMLEFEQMERARIFRECIEDRFCGYCQRQTLRVVFTGSRFRLACVCNFTTSPAA